MKIAILSDIHGNLPALQAVMAEVAKESCHRVICLGDIVGYGAWPNECCELLHEHSVLSVKGNHDLAAVQNGADFTFTPQAKACITWTREHLTESSLKMLRSLPESRKVERVTLCHGSLADPDEYVYSWRGALPSFERMLTQVGFLGHTHYAGWFYHTTSPPRGDGEMRPRGGTVKIDYVGKYLVNPGAVGQPRDGCPEAAYAVYEDNREEVELRRVPYDVEAAARGIIVAGLPPGMAARLFQGI